MSEFSYKLSDFRTRLSGLFTYAKLTKTKKALATLLNARDESYICFRGSTLVDAQKTCILLINRITADSVFSYSVIPFRKKPLKCCSRYTFLQERFQPRSFPLLFNRGIRYSLGHKRSIIFSLSFMLVISTSNVNCFRFF